MEHYLDYQNYVSPFGMPWVSAGAVLATALIIVIVRSVSAYKTRQLFPAVDSGLTKSIYDAEPLYREGYRKFKDTPYRVTTADGEKSVMLSQSNAGHLVTHAANSHVSVAR